MASAAVTSAPGCSALCWSLRIACSGGILSPISAGYDVAGGRACTANISIQAGGPKDPGEELSKELGEC